MKNSFKLKLLILLFSLLYSHSLLAANFDLDFDKDILQKNDLVILTISLNTEGQSINTIEGYLKYKPNFLKIETINTGGSFVNFWVNKPESSNDGTVYFSGVTPGGIMTNKGEVFKVIFRAEGVGTTNLSIEDISLFLNDGQGTLVNIKNENSSIKILKENNNILSPVISDDKIAPENFKIIRTRDNNIYENQWFIVFSTIDKNSGIDHYEICELFKCITGESPILLKNQTPFYYIKVNAYDVNNNMVSSTLISTWFYIVIIIFIFLIFTTISYFYRKSR